MFLGCMMFTEANDSFKGNLIAQRLLSYSRFWFANITCVFVGAGEIAQSRKVLPVQAPSQKPGMATDPSSREVKTGDPGSYLPASQLDLGASGSVSYSTLKVKVEEGAGDQDIFVNQGRSVEGVSHCFPLPPSRFSLKCDLIFSISLFVYLFFLKRVSDLITAWGAMAHASAPAQSARGTAWATE